MRRRRDFALGGEFALCIVPMQTIQLLGGTAARAPSCSARGAHLAPGGLLAVALADELELFEVPEASPGPLPDVTERRRGRLQQPPRRRCAARRRGFMLERRRETVAAAGELTVERDPIRLDALDRRHAGARGRGGRASARSGRHEIPATDDHVGSEVVMFRA